MNDPMPNRRDELLTDGALAWLDDADAGAFAALVREPEGHAEFLAYERTAAVTSWALAAHPGVAAEQQALLRLTARVQADALAFFAAAGRPEALPATPAPRAPAHAPSSHHLPWVLAAASLLIVVWSLLPPRALAPAAARAALLESKPGLTLCALQPGPSEHRGEVAGDVVWDAAGQVGFLRLQGLPPLAPHQRYQLWIVDATRQGPPVDGGLLDLPTGAGEVVVPVASRLPVQRVAAFVITLEPAEGVVVSAQEHVIAIGRP